MQFYEVLSRLLRHIYSLELPAGYEVVAEEKMCSCGQRILVLAKPNTTGGIVIFHDPLEQCEVDVVDQIEMLTESLLVRLQDEGMFPLNTVELVPSWHPINLSWLLTAVSPSGRQIMRASELAQLGVDQINEEKLRKLQVRPAFPCVLYAHLKSVLEKAKSSASASS